MMQQAELCERINRALATSDYFKDGNGEHYEALAYLKLPGPDYRQLLKALHKALKPKLYVEIGVRQGDSLLLAGPETDCIAIDPMPNIKLLSDVRPGMKIVVSTSDTFFGNDEKRQLANGFDLAFIDGDHSFEQANRDFWNLVSLSGPHSLIAIHDVIPMDAKTAQPKPIDDRAFHTGDVWRLMHTIVKHHPYFTAFTVACAPTGLGLVGNLHNTQFIGAHAQEIPTETPVEWDDIVSMVNVVPNTPGAILQALNKKVA